MIKIYKNNDIKVVTKGVFENLFKPLGYEQVKVTKVSKSKKDEDKVVPKFNKNKNDELE